MVARGHDELFLDEPPQFPPRCNAQELLRRVALIPRSLDLQSIVWRGGRFGGRRCQSPTPDFLSLSVAEIRHVELGRTSRALLPGEVYPRPDLLKILTGPVVSHPPFEREGEERAVVPDIGFPRGKGRERRRKAARGA